MLLSKVKSSLVENYTQAVSDTSQEFPLWSKEAPAIICNCSKSERLAHPYIGVISRTNVYSSILNSFSTACNPVYQQVFVSNIGFERKISPYVPKLTPQLANCLRALCSSHSFSDPEAEIEYNSAVMSHLKTQQCPVFQELNQFVVSLSSFLNGCYATRSSKIEPFQKQLILHTFFFLVSIKAPESTNKLFEVFKQYFDLFEMSQDKLQVFKQKASIFLIPRRHGKTWIVVAIISMLLACIEGIHIGYVAHQKHVANSVFTEILNTLYRHFPFKNIQIKKENGTIMYTETGKKPSTLMCATCFNKNVSTCKCVLFQTPSFKNLAGI
ncbi:hypothetical protein KM481_gp28 [Harp seal herpesvirus]|uniref:Probable DNA packing protein N-terminal domain-containing protein n=1 Tax=phocid gammaherpesvirus 3 TaxID=2560643 RepID=A0A0R5Z2T4_9GAMA|nr:hypothetical protein KM481_gp28 [Harp seal herpesvirus]AJG42958.1 hypothetical protein [Harp seal herpesvirus]